MKLLNNLLSYSVAVASACAVVSCGGSADSASTGVANESHVVRVFSYDADTIAIAQGTGVFIEPNKFVTNNHILPGAVMVGYSLEGEDSVRFDCKIVSNSADLDLALVTTTSAHNPLKVDATLEPGQMNTPEAKTLASTGSPLLNANGELCGITSTTVGEKTLVTKIIPMKYLSQMPATYTPIPLTELPDQLISVDSILVISEYTPCEAVLLTRNRSSQFVQNFKGCLIFFDENNQIYDKIYFHKGAHISNIRPAVLNVWTGDYRIHPTQYWNSSEHIFYSCAKSNTVKGKSFDYAGSTNDILECICRKMEVRVYDYELIDAQPEEDE